jgi:flagellar M-ring protein FliF
MRDRITSLGKRAGGTFGAFTVGQKAVTVVAVLVLGVGGYVFSQWAGKPSYAPLFSNLAASDASAIVDKLTADGTPYQLADGGGTILVPKDKVYDLRIKMSGAGLPAQADAGYQMLDKQGVMTSEFMQQVGYRRALEGELAKTIKSIDGVTGATVHLAIPQKDVFTDDQQKPTASVLVSTGSRQLSGDKVQAIVHLVAFSVEGLDPDSVTVVGAGGRVLSSNGSDATGGGADNRASQTGLYEQRLSTSLQQMLEQVLGPGHAVVQVTADLDFDATETKTQKYVSDPSNPPLSETKKTEAYTGSGGTGAGGVLGPNTTLPGAATGTAGTYQQQTETRNNAVGMVTEVRKSAPGAVRKLSVAVIVDSTGTKVDQTQLQQLVSSAVGLDPKRGDNLAVSAMAFDQSAATAEKTALADAQKVTSASQLESWIQTGSVVGGVLALLVMAFIANGRRRKQAARIAAETDIRLAEVQAAIEANRTNKALEGAGGTSALGAIEGGPAQGAEAAEREARQREIAYLVERQPDEVAQVLRGWLADRRG